MQANPRAQQRESLNITIFVSNGVTGGGCLGSSNTSPSLEIPKALQNRSKLNPIVKTIKNCWI
jgi:hypothetical protein